MASISSCFVLTDLDDTCLSLPGQSHVYASRVACDPGIRSVFILTLAGAFGISSSRTHDQPEESFSPDGDLTQANRRGWSLLWKSVEGAGRCTRPSRWHPRRAGGRAPR